ncbi:MAG TPA: MFS transporter, partial [Caulobacter sp.]|nr:MFS transporter [Caulobacter sp.]
MHPPCDEGAIRAHAAADQPAPRKRLALAATVLGSSMAFIDGSVVNVALPAMRAALKADAAQVQWIVNAYLLLLGALVLIGGSAGDRYGRRKVFVLGVVLFAAASLGCALA